MSHANAALTPRARLRLATLIVESGWTYSAAAKMFMVSPRTAAKWAGRYRVEGSAGMADRSSRPHRSPTKTPEQLVRRIVGLRWRHRLGPVQIAGQLKEADAQFRRTAANLLEMLSDRIEADAEEKRLIATRTSGLELAAAQSE